MLVAALLLHDKGFIVRPVNGNQIQRGIGYVAHDVIVRVLHDKTVAAVFLQRVKIQIGCIHALQKHAAKRFLRFGWFSWFSTWFSTWFGFLSITTTDRMKHDVCTHAAFRGQVPSCALLLAVGLMVKHVDHGALHKLLNNDIVIRKPAVELIRGRDYAFWGRVCHDFSMLVQNNRSQKPEGLQLVAFEGVAGILQNGMHVCTALPFLVGQI